MDFKCCLLNRVRGNGSVQDFTSEADEVRMSGTFPGLVSLLDGLRAEPEWGLPTSVGLWRVYVCMVEEETRPTVLEIWFLPPDALSRRLRVPYMAVHGARIPSVQDIQRHILSRLELK